MVVDTCKIHYSSTLLIIIWFGGLYEILSGGITEYVVVLIVLASILLIASAIFTLLPSKSDDWFETEERIK